MTATGNMSSPDVYEAGAVCGSSARTDLGGGQVTATPTATRENINDTNQKEE